MTHHPGSPIGLLDVVEDELDQVRGVRRVAATLAENPDSPTLWLDVATKADADLGRIRAGGTGPAPLLPSVPCRSFASSVTLPG